MSQDYDERRREQIRLEVLRQIRIFFENIQQTYPDTTLEKIWGHGYRLRKVQRILLVFKRSTNQCLSVRFLIYNSYFPLNYVIEIEPEDHLFNLPDFPKLVSRLVGSLNEWSNDCKFLISL